MLITNKTFQVYGEDGQFHNAYLFSFFYNIPFRFILCIFHEFFHAYKTV